MGIGDFIILAIIALFVFLAVRYCKNNRGCSGCNGCKSKGKNCGNSLYCTQRK